MSLRVNVVANVKNKLEKKSESLNVRSQNDLRIKINTVLFGIKQNETIQSEIQSILVVINIST